MTEHVLSIDGLSDARIDSILARAGEFADGAEPSPHQLHAGLLFFQPSLRSRVGFLAACARLGWPTAIEVSEKRESETSSRESLADTVAVLAAYLDVLVVRSGDPVEEVVAAAEDTTIVNAGDGGEFASHPTQALLDYFAMSRIAGEVSTLHIVVSGDLRMRAGRSLLALLARRRPASLTVVTDPSLTDGLILPAGLEGIAVEPDFSSVTGADVIYAVGIPHLGAEQAVRARLRVGARALEGLSERGVVLSPMPVIDEVAKSVRADSRLAFHRQSALGLPVRMAILESLLSQ